MSRRRKVPLKFKSPVWEQQPGEPDVWFQRFRIYALMPPATRSAEAVYNSMKEGPPRHKASGAWYRFILKFGWQERALAWDAERAKTIADTAEKNLEEFKNLTSEISVLVGKLLKQAVSSDEVESKKAEKRLAMILGTGKAYDSIMKGHSVHFGQKHEVKGDQFKTLTFNVE